MRARSGVVVATLWLVSMVGCSGGESERSGSPTTGPSVTPSEQAAVDSTAVASEPAARRECTDGEGDATPLAGFELDETAAMVVDLVGTSVEVDGTELVVTWSLAPGAAQTVPSNGARAVSLQSEPVAGGLPVVEVDVTVSAGLEPVASIRTITDAAGPTGPDEIDGATVATTDDAVVLSMPVTAFGELGGIEWRWSADAHTATSRDACGDADARAGTPVSFFPGVALPTVATPPEGDAAGQPSTCDRVPPIEAVEAVVGVELGEPGGRYATECSFNGVVDPTDYVLFSIEPTQGVCPATFSIGELGAVPYTADGGISGIVDFCLGDEQLRVTTSIGAIDDDDGPLALAIARVWLDAPGTA